MSANAPIGRVREIEVSLGFSIEINGIWYRPNARLTIEMNERNTKEVRDKAFSQAWKELGEQLEKQIRSLSGES